MKRNNETTRVANYQMSHLWLVIATYTVPDMTYNVFGGTLNLAQLNL